MAMPPRKKVQMGKQLWRLKTLVSWVGLFFRLLFVFGLCFFCFNTFSVFFLVWVLFRFTT